MESYKLLRLYQVKHKTGLGKSFIYASMKNHQFPAAIKIGPNSVAWLESEIDAWIEKQVNKSRKYPIPSEEI